MAYTYREVGSTEDYFKAAQAALSPDLEKAKTNINTASETQKQATTDIFNAQIDDTAISYEDSYRDNAVQKEINTRDVAENMANLGLTNSGLNRTQQTAVQLSYANNKAKIDMQKQAAVDALARSLATELANIETNRINSIADVENQYSQLAMDNATAQRNADIDYNATVAQAESDEAQAQIEADNEYNIAEMKAQYDYAAAIDTAQIEADTDVAKYNTDAYYKWVDEQEQKAEKDSYKIKQDGATLPKDMKGSFGANDISVVEKKDSYGNVIGYTYIDNNSGKKSYFALGVNPFTGKTHENVQYGTFDNGYQPNNLGVDKNGKVKKLTLEDGKAFPINGNVQNVFTYGGKYYVWDGRNNEYFEVKKTDLGNGKYRWDEVQ